MAQTLSPDGHPVALDGVELVTPGLSGVFEVHYPSGTGLRSADLATGVLIDALDATGVQEQVTVEIRDHLEVATSATVATRATGFGEPTITLKVPGPGSGMGQVLLVSDEDGVLRWVYPEGIPGDESVARGADERIYLVPRSVVEYPGGGDRGLIGVVGRKVFKVLAFRLLDEAVGAAAQRFAERWERQQHPHCLRTFEPSSYRSADVARLSPAELTALGAGPALLFIHGTMSLSHSGFGRLPVEALIAMHEAYEGRVFAFDHPTVSMTPSANAQWLTEELRGRQLKVDILAHSRGGLVGRVLAERPAGVEMAVDALSVRTLVMVGTPNDGTPLADAEHLGALVDTVTNLLEFVPDNAVTDVLAVVLSVVKQLAVGAFGGLDGITAMTPEGVYLTKVLNVAGGLEIPANTTAYVAVSSNYEPPQGAPLARFVRDRLLDRIFSAGNDLIVPNESVFGANGSPRFPITDAVDLGPADGVDHSSYWTCPSVLDRFTELLKA